MSEATRVACVMGWPAKQSRSPKLHGYWIKRYNIDGDYRVAEIPPEEFPAFVQSLAKNGFVGGNVTMPHKDVAFALSEPDERARAVGAANTLWIDNGKLRVTNTDVEGFIGALDVNAPGWDRSTDTADRAGCRRRQPRRDLRPDRARHQDASTSSTAPPPRPPRPRSASAPPCIRPPGRTFRASSMAPSC